MAKARFDLVAVLALVGAIACGGTDAENTDIIHQ